MDQDTERQLSMDAARPILVETLEDGLAISDEVIERAANAVHVAWLERHPHPNNPLDLRPYSDLDDTEKGKDRQFVRMVIEELTSVST